MEAHDQMKWGKRIDKKGFWKRKTCEKLLLTRKHNKSIMDENNNSTRVKNYRLHTKLDLDSVRKIYDNFI